MISQVERAPFGFAVAHVADPSSVRELIEVLHALHGEEYAFALKRWDGPTRLEAPAGRAVYLFVVEAAEARAHLVPGDVVRGVPAGGPYAEAGEGFGRATRSLDEALWPGDAIVLQGGESLEVDGAGVYFEVAAEPTAYRAAKLTLLRNLPSRPGGCASYEGAFRREALPPDRSGTPDDARGVNRVNEHTLDMRPDRTPLPRAHHHGPVPCGGGRSVNHSETAIVLPRSVYGLPEVEGEGRANGPAGRVVMFRRPAEDPADTFAVPLTPGSIVVTPATSRGVMGHRFENAFAMLVAIPGFVSPSRDIPV